MKKKAGQKGPIYVREFSGIHSKATPKIKRTVGALAVELIFSVLLLVAICALRTVHIFANNVGLVTFASLGASMWIYMGISIAVFAILRIFLLKPYFACIFVAFGTFLAVNFDWLVTFSRLFIKTYNPAVISGIILYLVLLAGFFFLLRMFARKKFSFHTLAKILSITFACLVLFNTVLAFAAIGKAASHDDAPKATPPVAALPSVAATPSRPADESISPTAAPEPLGLPNVYFFIMDEYSSFDMLSKYYGYDNKVFNDFLELEGFNIVRESYSTDNQTSHCICDLLNLEYISRDLSKDDCLEAISDARLFQVFSEMGYSQFQVASSKYFEGILSLNSDAGQEAYEDINMFGDESSDNVADGSISDAIAELLSGQFAGSDVKVDTEALNQWGFYPSDYIRSTKAYQEHDLGSYAKTLLGIFDYFEDPAHYAVTQPRVIYAYMLASHVPFIFDEYGGIIPFSQCRNWEDPNVYLNQYKFATKHLMASISTIIDNDPDSIIILMSDHGIRYHEDCKKKHTFYITNKDSCRIFNAVYVKGQQYDMEGLSGVNTLRYILSLYEGLDYPPIDAPITSDSPDDLIGIIPKPR